MTDVAGSQLRRREADVSCTTANITQVRRFLANSSAAVTDMSYDLEGKTWPIENHGVDPDIVVDNDPAREYAGVDEQLNRAIAVALEEMRNQPTRLPPPPPIPKR